MDCYNFVGYADFCEQCLWLWAWMQYDYESYEITADGDSNANYIGQDGNIYNSAYDGVPAQDYFRDFMPFCYLEIVEGSEINEMEEVTEVTE